MGPHWTSSMSSDRCSGAWRRHHARRARRTDAVRRLHGARRARAHDRRRDDVRRRLPRCAPSAADTDDVLGRLRSGARGTGRGDPCARRARPDRRRAVRRGSRRTFARFVVLDGLVHGWDLARRPVSPTHLPMRWSPRSTRSPTRRSGRLRDGEMFADPVDPPAGDTDRTPRRLHRPDRLNTRRRGRRGIRPGPRRRPR